VSTEKKKQNKESASAYWFDPLIVLITLALICLGLIMVASSSISIADKVNQQPLFYFYRQLIAVLIGLAIGFIVFLIPLNFWNKYAMHLLAAGIVMLILVLIPGVGKEVNGSSRWIPMGLFNLQVSELLKLLFIMYLSGYIYRKQHLMLQGYKMFMIPLGFLIIVSLLLLLEPDLGAAVVIAATAMIMLFIAGVPLPGFIVLVLAGIGMAYLLIVYEPYRLARFQSFTDPWSDPFNTGFQLTQSLMAFGRSEWAGSGLGHSVQKLFYLPEAHTDFIFAIIAEELGMIGVLAIIVLFILLLFRVFYIAKQAFLQNKIYQAFLLFGIGIWICLQSFINIGVNMGVLPTKGLTLPFISYGGSSIMIMCIAVAMVLRAEYESRCSKNISLFHFQQKAGG
jgi:cell division protein FtsW